MSRSRGIYIYAGYIQGITTHGTSIQHTGLLMLAASWFLDGAPLAEAADGAGQPLPQRVPGALGPGRRRLQRAHARLAGLRL